MIAEWFSAMWMDAARGLCNHLWQSTLFAGVVALLAVLLRRNHARTRHWLWVAASVKFLVPFSLLVALGSHVPWPSHAAPAEASTYIAIDAMSQPFSDAMSFDVPMVAPAAQPAASPMRLLPAALAGTWLLGAFAMTMFWLVQWRRVRKAVRAAVPLLEGREAEALRRMEQAAGVKRRIQLRMHPQGMMEPGVFGICRPVLLWPEGISRHLDDAHLERVLAHEVCHVRRRDNLTSVVPMLVEAVFWFHPLVWWMERQLVKERERACDEDVLLRCGEPGVYAQSILKVCEYCVESPLTCVAGITGADLKQRVVEIMTARTALRLTWPKKLLLGAVAVCAVGVPVMLGQAKAMRGMMLAAIQSAPRPFRAAARAMIAIEQTPSSGEIAEVQSFADAPAAPSPMYQYEAATVKPSKGPGPNKKIGLWAAPDGFSAWFTTPQQLISIAYGVKGFQISGGPSWLTSERFDVEAKMDAATADALRKLSKDQRALAQQQMLQALLADRFQLKVHRETKELPTYTLVIAKGGPKLHVAKPGDTYPNGFTYADGTHAGAGDMAGSDVTGDLTAQSVPVARLVLELTQMLGRPVSDKTELKGVYDFKLRFTPDDRLQPPSGSTTARLPLPPADSNAPSLFDALQEQLGLKLVAGKGPADVIVIDHIEKPASVDGAEVQGQAGMMPVALVQEKAAPAAASQPAGVIGPDLLSIADIAAPTAITPAIDFDVFSIKVNKSSSQMRALNSPPDGDGITLENLSLFDIMRWNFNIRSFREDQLVGVPKWFASERFDIQAKVAAADLPAWRKLNEGQRRLVFRKLLVDQFKLAAHWANVEGPVYNLVLAKGGLKIKPVKAGDPNPDAPKGQDGTAYKGSGVFLINRTPSDQKFVFQEISLSWLAKGFLSNYAGRQAYDKTGLPAEAIYDFTLQFAPDRAAAVMPGSAAGEASAPVDSGPSLFTALEEQLGLKLEPGKGPVGRLVIDHVELPTEN